MALNKPAPQALLTRGEPAAAESPRTKIRDEFSYPVIPPGEGAAFEIEF